MGARCMVCDHGARVKIERALVSGASLRGMGREFEVGRMALARHRDEHPQPRIDLRNYAGRKYAPAA
jgi:hypothetical protein